MHISEEKKNNSCERNLNILCQWRRSTACDSGNETTCARTLQKKNISRELRFEEAFTQGNSFCPESGGARNPPSYTQRKTDTNRAALRS